MFFLDGYERWASQTTELLLLWQTFSSQRSNMSTQHTAYSDWGMFIDGYFSCVNMTVALKKQLFIYSFIRLKS